MEHPLNLTSFLPANIQHHYLHVIMLCVAVCIIFFLGLYVRSLRSEIPSKSQNFFEVLVGGLSNLAVDVMGKEDDNKTCKKSICISYIIKKIKHCIT